jgi:hypothetical protein
MIVLYKDVLELICFIWPSLQHPQGGQGMKMLE